MASGCEECSQSVMAELTAAAESGEELDEDVQAVMRGEKEVPFAYGPLSGWTGPYCRFCFGTGIVLSVTLLVLTLIVGLYYQAPISYSLVFGAVIFVPSFVSVMWLGRYPLLGALVGPFVEKRAAMWFNVYLTTKAKQKYGGYQMVMTGERPQDRSFSKHGTEMHIIATDWAIEQCASPLAPGALLRVEVDQRQTGPAIVDWHNFDPDANGFQNLIWHVNINAPTVCQGGVDNKTTTLNFSEMAQTQGRGGIE